MNKAIQKATAFGLVCALTLGCAGIFGCSSSSTTVKSADDRVSTAKVTHEGRYETMGVKGCYGCHGSNGTAWPMLADAPKLPTFHFTKDKPTSIEDLEDAYSDCATCHFEITGKKTDAKTVTSQTANPSAEATTTEGA